MRELVKKIHGIRKKSLNKSKLFLSEDVQDSSARPQRVYRLDTFQELLSTFSGLMIFFQFCVAFVWWHLLGIRAAMVAKRTQVGVDTLYEYKLLVAYLCCHCIINVYGWVCIQKLKWRRGRVALAATGAPLFILALSHFFSMMVRGDFNFSTPPRDYLGFILLAASCWDTVLLSLLHWRFKASGRKKSTP